MQLLNEFLTRSEFSSYEDFYENFSLKIPERFNFAGDVVDVLAKRSPHQLALLYCNDEGAEHRMDFKELSDCSKRAAAYFLSLGIRQGERVVLILRRRIEYWICAVALHRIGAVAVPASIQFTAKDLAYRINTAKASAIIYLDTAFCLDQVRQLTAKNCPTLRQRIFVREEGGQQPQGAQDFCAGYPKCEPFEQVEREENSAEFIAYFTSGTTGMPKMALHNKTYPLGHILTAKYMQCAKDNGLHLTMADSGWAKFGWGNLYGQWICGCAVLAYDPIRFHAANLLSVMERYQPTSLCVPPTMYRFLLSDGLQKRHVRSITWFSTAGEPLAPEVNRQFQKITGHPIHEGFGQSEGTPITCSFEFFEVRPGSMGKPSPLYRTRIIGKDHQPCRQGDVGEIVLTSAYEDRGRVGLTAGYIRDEAFEGVLRDGVYHTGDMAYEDEDGYYWFVGRNDDMIKCSGYRIGPSEIEGVLNAHHAVRESAIIGRPDPIRGQVVCAVIALQDGFAPSKELTKQLQDYVKQNTAPYKYPRIIEYVPQLPKTSSGKILRRALAQ